jgi:hypothetical protein
MATNVEVLTAISKIESQITALDVTVGLKIAAVDAKVDLRMDMVESKVKHLEDKVIGNGKPGVIVEQILQSGKIDQLLDYAKISAASIESLRDVTPPKWLTRNWYKIVVFLILFFIIVHTLLPDTSIIQLIGMLKG